MKPAEEAFKQLYLDYYAALCYFATKIVGDEVGAEDIVEDVFVKLLHSEKVFAETDNIRAYLYVATRNSSLTHLTKLTHDKERQWQYHQGLPEHEQSYVNEIIKAEVLRKIKLALEKLPAQMGQVIELSYFQDLKNAEIAEVLGISVQTVKNLKVKGLAALRGKLSPEVFVMFMLVYGLNGM